MVFVVKLDVAGVLSSDRNVWHFEAPSCSDESILVPTARYRRNASDRIGRWTGRPVALIALASSHRRRRIMLTTRLNCTSKTGLCGFLLDGRNLALFDAVREKSPAMHSRM